MEAVMQWGMRLIAQIQQVRGPVVDGIFQAITLLGAEQFYPLFLPFVFWCIDYQLGVRLAILTFLSAYLNADLKDLFRQPRPFEIDPSVGLSTAEGYGLPSGHSQSAVVVWGVIAIWARKRRVWAASIALVLLIGFSRIYLGVHFPTDVLAGWAIGAILLYGYVRWRFRVETWLTRMGRNRQVLLALGFALVLILIHPTKETVTALAPLAGMGIGIALIGGRVPFSAGGPWGQRVARYLLGIAVVLALYVGLSALSPDDTSGLYLPFRFLRFGLLGLWVSLGAPWLFIRLGLASEESPVG